MTITGKELALDKIGLDQVDRIIRNLPVEGIIEDIILHRELSIII